MECGSASYRLAASLLAGRGTSLRGQQAPQEQGGGSAAALQGASRCPPRRATFSERGLGKCVVPYARRNENCVLPVPAARVATARSLCRGLLPNLRPTARKACCRYQCLREGGQYGISRAQSLGYFGWNSSFPATGTGTIKKNVFPSPSLLSAQIRPPLSHDAPANGQAQTGASLLSRVGDVNLLKSFEDTFQLVVGNTASLVLDLKQNLIASSGAESSSRFSSSHGLRQGPHSSAAQRLPIALDRI